MCSKQKKRDLFIYPSMHYETPPKFVDYYKADLKYLIEYIDKIRKSTHKIYFCECDKGSSKCINILRNLTRMRHIVGLLNVHFASFKNSEASLKNNHHI